MSVLRKFLFEGLPVRGMLVRLTDGWQEVLRRRQTVGEHPPEVRVLLGEMAAAGVLMQANIKFNGALVLQMQGDGPVKIAVAEVQPDLAFRATAKVVGEVPAGAQLEALMNVHGQGRCAITLDPKDRLPGQQPDVSGDHRLPSHLQTQLEALQRQALRRVATAQVGVPHPVGLPWGGMQELLQRKGRAEAKVPHIGLPARPLLGVCLGRKEMHLDAGVQRPVIGAA
jgi:hypothetical protein